MRALQIAPRGKLSLDTVARPHLENGMVRLLMWFCGLCGSDLHQLRAMIASFDRQFVGIFGHEAVAKVTEGGGELNGRIVLPHVFKGCGTCKRCRRHEPQFCEAKQTVGLNINGLMAEEAVFPKDMLLAVDNTSVGPERLAFVEVLSVGSYACHLGEIGAGQKVLIIGCGPIAYACAAFAKLLGADEITVVGLPIDEGRLALFADVLGCRTVVWKNPENIALSEALGREAYYDAVLECSGSVWAQPAVPSVIQKRGKCVLIAMYDRPLVIPDYNAWMRVADPENLYGSRPADFEAGLAMVQGHTDWFPNRMFSVVQLEDAVDAIHAVRLRTSETFKLLVQCNTSGQFG